MKKSALATVCALALLGGCAEKPEPKTRQPNSAGVGTLEYGCGGRATFTPEDISRETPPSKGILEAIDRLRQTMDGSYLPEGGWFAISEEADRADLLAPLNDQYVSASFERRGDAWKPVDWGDCLPRLQVSDKSVLRWAFTEGSYPPEPEATKLELLVSEVQCSSGRKLDGLIEPAVDYNAERIEVALTAPALGGSQNCIGTAPTKYELVLDEPAGDRSVVDLSVYPVVDPNPGTPLP